MASVNKSYVNTEDFEMSNMSEDSKIKASKSFEYEEVLNFTGLGSGRYHIGLLFACFMVITAMGIDIFGLGIIATAATCDLGMDLRDIGILSSMPFAGIILMSYPWGYLSDTRGRRLVLMWAMTGSFISAVLSSLAPSWQVLAACRFISSALSSAAESVTYALIGECCSAKTRSRFMLLITSALMLTPTLYYIWGYFIMKLDFAISLSFIVYRPWRLLTLVMAAPLGVSALMLYWFHESPKFLVNVGRKEEALEVLKKIYIINGGTNNSFPVKHIYLDEGNREEVGKFSLQSLWAQIAPLFKPPLISWTILLFYLTFVTYIANNSFAIILPTIFNVFFQSYSISSADTSFCQLFAEGNSINATSNEVDVVCKNTIEDNTIWAGCAHGVSFFILNALISFVANKKKMVTITILIIAAAASLGIDNSGDAVAGLALFYIFLTTAMVFGIISSYFVDLYPTSYRGMVACLGMVVARVSAFAGTNIISSVMTSHCSEAFYGASAVILSGVVAASFLPKDGVSIS